MSGLPNVQQNNEQILNDIQSLQQMEKQMFTNLESQLNLSPEQQNEIIDKINQLSSMRVNLYQTLGGVNDFFKNALTSSVGTLKEQTSAIAIVESELNRAKKRLEVLEEEKNNKIRLVEINEYYGDKYSEHSKLMKIVIFTLVPIIILAFLNNAGFLPNMIYYVLLSIVAIIGSVYFWKIFASLIMRDNMNYQEYYWYFDAKNAPAGKSSSVGSKDPWSKSDKTVVCVGDACCSVNQSYDSILNKCVDNPMSSSSSTGAQSNTNNASQFGSSGISANAMNNNWGGVNYSRNLVNSGNYQGDEVYMLPAGNVESFITEEMVGNVLTKTQAGKHKTDVSLIPSYASAFSMNI